MNDPRINDHFPIQESLSPPIVASPIPECAEAVYVSGFVPHARVQVFANLIELLADETPPFGFADIRLSRPLGKGESITATQIVEAVTSPHSLRPVIVSALPDHAVRTTKPRVGRQLYQCGIVVPVGNLVPRVRVHVTENGTEIGSRPTACSWHGVFTAPLHAGGAVSAYQVACEGTPHEVHGPAASTVTVRPAPSPVPSPRVDAEKLIAGNDKVTLHGLLVGARVEIFDHGALVCTGWYATEEDNYFFVSPPLTAISSISATQELCGNVSPPSAPVPPEGRLDAPVIVGPICPGARFVVLRRTTINATVVVMRNGVIVGYGGAAPDDVVLSLGGGAALNAGDVVTAYQYMGPTVSPPSSPIVVSAGLEEPAIEILGGEPFFLAKGGEQSIDGPVFPRGVGLGPDIRIQACCSQAVQLQILGPSGELVAEPPLTEVFPGYYSASWPWSSMLGWPVPDGIPVGRYLAVVRTGCDQREGHAPFYLIFNPADIGGPPRFSFDDTAVWFGTDTNSMAGLHYYLHPSDKRVFDIAINAARGHIDSYQAAVAVARAEEALFAYSLNYHTNDVVTLLSKFSEAQCADDAACLTAFLRAVGIPAHPVTADAGLETGAANWTFDTWIEFLAPHAGSTDWRILHPHQYKGMSPESRSTFGMTRGVATKSFNDLIVMANERWVSAALDDGKLDVRYGRNSCNEPEEHIIAASWVTELCEQGYWSPAHWDCTSARAWSLAAENGLQLQVSDMTFGGRVAGSLHVVNRSGDRRFGRFALELVARRLESKQFPVASFGCVAVPMALDSGRSMTVPFELTLPKALAPGLDLFLWAHLDGRTAVLRELRMPSSVECQVTLPAQLGLGNEAEISATVHNVTENVLQDVGVEIDAPYALCVEQPYHRVGDLGPRETRALRWLVRVIAPLRSGSLHVAVSVGNGGGALVRRSFRIADLESSAEAAPGLFAPPSMVRR